MHLFNKPVPKESALKLLVLVTVVCALAALALSFPPSWLKNLKNPFKSGEVGSSQFYAAPLAASQIPGNPAIQPTPVGQLPDGFPAEFTLIGQTEIVQAYRSLNADRPGTSGTVVFISDKSVSEVVKFYEQWLSDHGYQPKLNLAKNANAVFASKSGDSFTISAFPNSTGVLVVVTINRLK